MAMVSFIKNPFYTENKFAINNKNISAFASCFCVCYLIIICVSMFLSVLDYILVHKFAFPSIRNDLKFTNTAFINKDILNAILVLTLAPVVEELIFRLSLIPKRRYILIILVLITYTILGGKFNNLTFFQDIYKIVIFFASSLFSILIFYKINLGKVRNFIKNHYTLYFYIFVFAFGLIHILNIKIIHWNMFYLYPIFVLPQLILGFAIAYLRNTIHFLYGLLMHIVVNFIAVFFTLL
jgi:hypothetical protein